MEWIWEGKGKQGKKEPQTTFGKDKLMETSQSGGLAHYGCCGKDRLPIKQYSNKIQTKNCLYLQYPLKQINLLMI